MPAFARSSDFGAPMPIVTYTLASTGEPLFCHPHPATDVEQTRQVILQFLTTLDIGETTILEAVVPGAFAAAYPCGGPAL